jgi:hypothetical protein
MIKFVSDVMVSPDTSVSSTNKNKPQWYTWTIVDSGGSIKHQKHKVRIQNVGNVISTHVLVWNHTHWYAKFFIYWNLFDGATYINK